MGRPKIEKIIKRSWYKSNVKQIEYPEMPEYDHLIWTGEEQISRYSAPRVTSPSGFLNVRKVLWKECWKVLPGAGQKVVPNCGRDDCISPRHGVVISKAEADAAAWNGESASPKYPWLLVGKRGAHWNDFVVPYGQSFAFVMRRAQLAATSKQNTPKAWIDKSGQPAVVVDLMHVHGRVRAKLTEPSIWKSATGEEWARGVLNCRWASGTWNNAVEVAQRIEEACGRPVVCLLDTEDDGVPPWYIHLPLTTEDPLRWEVEEPED